jgi:short subunit dehydrogenase-like uncharacterized protein
MKSEDRRTFDVVLFGATGFTGKLVAEYLARRVGARIPWALAGRSTEKLEAVRSDLAKIEPGLKDLAILIADSHDEAALEAIVPKARVVCTTVGPYAKHGRTLVRLCAKHGTSYCDITGEVPFIRASIDENHRCAEETHARIVHCCGYDSIPFDLGVHLLWNQAKKRGDNGLAWAKGFAGRTKGGFSGGTLSSMIELIASATKDKDVRRVLSNPHALDPEPPPRSAIDPFEQDQRGIRFDNDLDRWTAPFLMAAVNTRVVRRSNALLGYGDRFRYNESMSLPKGPKGLVAASAVTAGIAGFAAVAAFPPTRKLLAKAVTAPGEGPSKEARDAGYFETHVVAEGEGGERLRALVAGDSDPGYGETAKMLGESALCLAHDRDKLETRYGVLTPASAMGMNLVERLREAGMTFVAND